MKMQEAALQPTSSPAGYIVTHWELRRYKPGRSATPSDEGFPPISRPVPQTHMSTLAIDGSDRSRHRKGDSFEIANGKSLTRISTSSSSLFGTTVTIKRFIWSSHCFQG